jgi:hypothetical protein
MSLNLKLEDKVAKYFGAGRFRNFAAVGFPSSRPLQNTLIYCNLLQFSPISRLATSIHIALNDPSFNMEKSVCSHVD